MRETIMTVAGLCLMAALGERLLGGGLIIWNGEAAIQAKPHDESDRIL